MSVCECLKRAQRTLSSGAWMVNPVDDFARADIWDSKKPGNPCSRSDEELAFMTVHGALLLSARDDAERSCALELLEQVATPAFHAESQFFGLVVPPDALSAQWWGRPENSGNVLVARALMRASLRENIAGLDAWLSQPTLKLSAVLRLFDLAILRAGLETH